MSKKTFPYHLKQLHKTFVETSLRQLYKDFK